MLCYNYFEVLPYAIHNFPTISRSHRQAYSPSTRWLHLISRPSVSAVYNGRVVREGQAAARAADADCNKYTVSPVISVFLLSPNLSGASPGLTIWNVSPESSC